MHTRHYPILSAIVQQGNKWEPSATFFLRRRCDIIGSRMLRHVQPRHRLQDFSTVTRGRSIKPPMLSPSSSYFIFLLHLLVVHLHNLSSTRLFAFLLLPTSSLSHCSSLDSPLLSSLAETMRSLANSLAALRTRCARPLSSPARTKLSNSRNLAMISLLVGFECRRG